MPGSWETKQVLIAARTYPAPHRKRIEVSCTAGITDSSQWIRLFPVPYRFLAEDKKFRKYQWVELQARRATTDHRPETYMLNIDSIHILSDPLPPTNKWEKRKAVIGPLIAPSLCSLEAEREQKGSPTLGIFRPRKIESLEIRPTKTNWSADQLARLRQNPLFGQTPANELEKLPFEFRYHFQCDDAFCKGHNLMCTDWEMGAAYRKWKAKYGRDWEGKFRQRFETEMIELNDTHFYVGTVHRFPNVWLVVGLFYPRK